MDDTFLAAYKRAKGQAGQPAEPVQPVVQPQAIATPVVPPAVGMPEPVQTQPPVAAIPVQPVAPTPELVPGVTPYMPQPRAAVPAPFVPQPRHEQPPIPAAQQPAIATTPVHAATPTYQQPQIVQTAPQPVVQSIPQAPVEAVQTPQAAVSAPQPVRQSQPAVVPAAALVEPLPIVRPPELTMPQPAPLPSFISPNKTQGNIIKPEARAPLQVTSAPDTKPSGSSRKKIMAGATIATLCTLIAIGAIFTVLNWPLFTKKTAETVSGQANPAVLGKQQALADQYVTEVGKLIDLPKDEAPRLVATISDVEKLKKVQAFFNKAKNGDVVIVYASKAILYDPIKKMIIDTASVDVLATPEPSSATASASPIATATAAATATPKPRPKVTPTPTPTSQPTTPPTPEPTQQ